MAVRLDDYDDAAEALRQHPGLALRSPATNGDLFVGVQDDHFVLAQIDERSGLDVSKCKASRVRMLASDDDAELVDRVEAVKHLRERKRAGEEHSIVRNGGQVRATLRCGSCGRNDFETVDDLKNHDCPDEDDEDDEGHSAPALVTDGGRDQEEVERLGDFEEELQENAEREEIDLYTTVRHNAADISVQAPDLSHHELRVWLEEHGCEVVQAETGGYFCVRPADVLDDRWPEADGTYRIRDAETGGDEA